MHFRGDWRRVPVAGDAYTIAAETDSNVRLDRGQIGEQALFTNPIGGIVFEADPTQRYGRRGTMTCWSRSRAHR